MSGGHYVMKKLIACAIASAVIGIAVLGFRTMIHGGDHMPTDCVVTVLGTRCGDGWSPLANAASHVSTIKAFTRAVLFAGVVIAGWFIALRLLSNLAAALSPPLAAHQRIFSSYPVFLRSLRWLALREKRDPSAP